MRVEGGLITQELARAAEERGLFYPVDFAATGSSTIGGNIATNAGGMRVIHYGMTRDWVLGLKVVTGTGAVLELGGTTLKNNTGLDLLQLFIGSEGCLGFIAEATLRLAPPPVPSFLALAGLANLKNALELLERGRASGYTFSLFEIFDESSLAAVRAHRGFSSPLEESHPWYALLEIEDDAGGEKEEEFLTFAGDLLEKETIQDLALPESSAARAVFRAYREDISESLGAAGHPRKYDVSSPLENIVAFERRARERIIQSGLAPAIFGHLGDGNLHVNVRRPESMSEEEFREKAPELDAEIYGLVREVSGSVSAEHGIGLLKRKYLEYNRSPEEIALMRAIKKLLDPAGILNPGKSFAE